MQFTRTTLLVLVIIVVVMGVAVSGYVGATKPGPLEYDRDLYKHWIDADGDCQDTRQEILIMESLVVVELTEDGCRVTSGLWVGAYTGEVFTSPSELDIDHIVPLSEAHASGAWAWDDEQRETFANDPDNLVAVRASANRSKGADDPARWLPPNLAYLEEYLRQYKRVKAKYDLFYDAREESAFLLLQALAKRLEFRFTPDEAAGVCEAMIPEIQPPQ